MTEKAARVESSTWVAKLVTPAHQPRVLEMAAALGLVVITATDAQIVLGTTRGDVLEYCTNACRRRGIASHHADLISVALARRPVRGSR